MGIKDAPLTKKTKELKLVLGGAPQFNQANGIDYELLDVKSKIYSLEFLAHK